MPYDEYDPNAICVYCGEPMETEFHGDSRGPCHLWCSDCECAEVLAWFAARPATRWDRLGYRTGELLKRVRLLR